MNIGLLIYGSLDTLSGGYFYDRELVKYLRARGDKVGIISLPWRNYAAHLGDNLRFRLPENLDILIEDELNHPSLLAANARIHPYPVVSLVHHLRCSEQHPAGLLWFYHAVERRYLRSVDAFIYNSNTTHRAVCELDDRQAPGMVAYPPVSRFGPALSEKEVALRALQPGLLRLVFLGNVIPRKGLHLLLEALRLAPHVFHLDVIGSLKADPVYAGRMQQVCRASGLTDQVAFHGALADQSLAETLRSSQVLVVPSSYEGFGIVYLEGMCFGLPAIGSTNGAAGEVITQGKTGYLVDPSDAALLSTRLQALAADRDLLREISFRALERYSAQPAWEQGAESIRQFLIQLAAGKFVQQT